MKKLKQIGFAFLLCTSLLLTGCVRSEVNANATQENAVQDDKQPIVSEQKSFSMENIPAFSTDPYVVINNNMPFFSDSELSEASFEEYSKLDELGRCGAAYASVGKDIMPTEKRGSISHVKPSGWKTAKYDWVDGKYLYNRCHLLGFQLTAENDNEQNLITGTRYMNVDGMLPFENMIADYVKETGNHVQYRVTPIYEGDNLVASGVLMEAKSVEDQGEGVLFNVYCYNAQPGVEIDYATGISKASEQAENQEKLQKENTYILNTNTKKFHKTTCSGVTNLKQSNKEQFTGQREELIKQGYAPCKNCNP